MSITSTGRIHFWQGGSLWIGQGQGRTEWHEHHAHQLTMALQGGFRFRTQEEGEWMAFTAAIVPSHCPHQFEIEGSSTMAHLFVEPESREGRALAARFGSKAVAELASADSADAAAALFQALRSGISADDIIETAKRATAALCGVAAGSGDRLDPRLGRALDYIHKNIRESIAMSDVASAVALSESRFRHLFVAGTGSSFRAYLLWLRINRAIAAVMAGASWTEAAHDAGFADSAHLARTHKRMFGIEPTAIRPLPP
jgi:AraC family transcriptional regulator